MKKLLTYLFSFSLLSGCGTQINFDAPVAPISIQSSINNFSSVIPVIKAENNGGHSRIVRRKSGELVMVYGSEKYGDKHVYLTSSQNTKNWKEPVRITNGILSDINPTIIEDKNNLLRVFYSSNQNGSWEIFQTSSRDSISWSEPEKLNIEYQGVSNPQIIENNQGDLILIYETFGSGIFISKSSDGKKWQTFPFSSQGKNPYIQLSDDNYIVAYENNKQILAQSSKDLINWTESKSISNFSHSKNPSLSMKGKNLLLSYTALDNSKNWNIYTQELGINLNTLSGAKKITNNSFNNIKPSIITTDKTSIISWTVENQEFITNNKAIYLGIGL